MIRPTLHLLVAATCVAAFSSCQGTASTDNSSTTAEDAAMSARDLGRSDVTETSDFGMTSDVDTTSDAAGGPPDTGSDAGPDMPVAPVGSAGCGSPDTPLADGEHTFMLDGRERRFMLRIPSNYDGENPVPVVFALHGNGGNVSYWDSTGGDRDIRAVLADEAILVVAEAIEGNWRDYGADRATWPERIELELNYFDTIIERLSNEMCIEPQALFAMGFSGGGSFSGVLGCRRTDIRAIAVGGSVIYFDEANCVGKPAAWITIGEGELEPPRETYRDWFRDRAGCETTTTSVAPEPCVAYDGCDDGTPVHYCQHPAGHVWPAFGTQAAWDFFAQFVDR